MNFKPTVLEGEQVRLEPLTLSHADAFYKAAREWSLSKDLAILVKTVPTIIHGEKRDEPLIRRALLEQQSTIAGEKRS